MPRPVSSLTSIEWSPCIHCISSLYLWSVDSNRVVSRMTNWFGFQRNASPRPRIHMNMHRLAINATLFGIFDQESTSFVIFIVSSGWSVNLINDALLCRTKIWRAWLSDASRSSLSESISARANFFCSSADPFDDAYARSTYNFILSEKLSPQHRGSLPYNMDKMLHQIRMITLIAHTLQSRIHSTWQSYWICDCFF